MKSSTLYLLPFLLLFTQCISVHLSDINPDLDVYAEVNADIYFNGDFHSNGDLSYSQYNRKSGSNFIDVSFKKFSGEYYFTLEISEPTELHLRNQVDLKSGTLSFTVQDEGSEKLWEKTYQGAIVEENMEDIHIEKAGNYRIYVSGNASKSHYVLQWN